MTDQEFKSLIKQIRDNNLYFRNIQQGIRNIEVKQISENYIVKVRHG
jgi:hypothetical protein